MGLPLFNRQSRKRDQIVAIDLGGRVTKAVHLQRKGDKFNLVNYALLDAPASDKAIPADVLAEHLKNVSKALGAGRTRPVTLAVGVQDTLFRHIEAPLMPLADLRQMLKYNAKTYLQQELANYVFDCFYVPPKSTTQPGEAAKPNFNAAKNKVLVGGIKRQTLDDLQAAVKGAGLTADQMVPSAVAPANAFELAEPEIFATEPLALVDLGFKHTTITVLDGGDLALYRVVGLGGDRLTAGLADSMNISYDEAENIKVGMPAEVQANLESLLHPLGRELRASIDFFENHHDKTVNQVFVSGGSAGSEFILQALQNELMVPCKTWNPAKTLPLLLPPAKLGEVDQIAPQLTVAIGAAAAAF